MQFPLDIGLTGRCNEDRFTHKTQAYDVQAMRSSKNDEPISDYNEQSTWCNEPLQKQAKALSSLQS